MSVSQTRRCYVFVLLTSCAPGPPTLLSIPVRAFSRYTEVPHSVVRDLHFLGNVLLGIVFIFFQVSSEEICIAIESFTYL